jgi:phytoene dehydrogenase-like protein
VLLFAVAGAVLAQACLRHPCERGALPPRLPVDDSVRKQRLTKRKLDAVLSKPVDAVVIGSGMGGLSCAAMLSRQGQRVVVLEQHDVAGGSTHTFTDRGYEFDTGLHYIGGPAFGTGMMPSEGTNLLLNCLTDGCDNGPIEWTRMADDYDIAVQGKLRFPMPAGKETLIASLCQQFPADEAMILRYMLQLILLHRIIQPNCPSLWLSRYSSALSADWWRPDPTRPARTQRARLLRMGSC